MGLLQFTVNGQSIKSSQAFNYAGHQCKCLSSTTLR